MAQQKTDGTGRLNEKLFISLIVRNERRVRGFIATLLPLGSYSDIDDLVQEVSVVAWEKHQSFLFTEQAPDDEFVRWVCTIAKFKVANYRRTKANSKVVVPFDETLVEQLASIQLQSASHLEDRHALLANCLKKMREHDQEVLRLRYEQERPIAEVAHHMGRSIDAAYKALARIRSRLMKCIELSLQHG